MNGRDPTGLFSTAGFSASISTALSLVGNVVSTVGTAFSVINAGLTAIDVANLIFDIATGGSLSQTVRQAADNYFSQLRSNADPKISVLFTTQFWEQSADSFSRNIPRIGKSLLRSSTAKNTFSQAAGISTNRKFPRLVIQMPAPPVPGFTLPKQVVELPLKVRLGPLSVGVGLQFGASKKHKGRVLGFAIQTHAHESSIRQVLRQDYHDWHPYNPNSGPFKDIRWLDKQGVMDFHYHVPK